MVQGEHPRIYSSSTRLALRFRACFERTVGDCLREEIGEEEFESLSGECKGEFQFAKHRDAQKNPAVMEAMLARASEQGKSCETLTRIVHEILQRRETLGGAS